MKRFDITRATHLYPPYGLWIVQYRGTVIGKQLSQPCQDDCERMLRVHRESKQHDDFADLSVPRTFSYHLGGATATKASQRRGGYNKRGTLRRNTT